MSRLWYWKATGPDGSKYGAYVDSEMAAHKGFDKANKMLGGILTLTKIGTKRIPE